MTKLSTIDFDNYPCLHLLPESDLFEKVSQLEQELLKEPQVEMPVVHHFSKGVYAREIHMPKDTIVTGKIHKHEHLCIISKGDVSIATEEGVKRVQAPYTMVSPPGCKRVLYIHEDTVWTTIHVTDERDLEKLEEMFVCTTREEYKKFKESQLCHGDLWVLP